VIGSLWWFVEGGRFSRSWRQGRSSSIAFGWWWLLCLEVNCSVVGEFVVAVVGAGKSDMGVGRRGGESVRCCGERRSGREEGRGSVERRSRPEKNTAVTCNNNNQQKRSQKGFRSWQDGQESEYGVITSIMACTLAAWTEQFPSASAQVT